MKIHNPGKIATAFALVTLSAMTGCTPKGSSGSGSGGGTNSNSGGGGNTSGQPNLVSLEASDGICPDSNGTFPSFNGVYNNIYTNSPALVPNADPSCDIVPDPHRLFDILEVHLKINTTGAGIDHYDWEITPDLRGHFDPFFTTTNSAFLARTTDDTIAYFTVRNTDFYALNDLPNAVFNITISSTAFTSGGRFTAGFFNLTFVWPDPTQVTPSPGGAEISHANPSHFADFYLIQAAGAVIIEAIGETNSTGSLVVHVYNDQLQQTYVDDGTATGFAGYSRVNANLTATRSYYVEIEQATKEPYYVLVAADPGATNTATIVQKTLQVPSPWDGRTYSGRVTELDYLAQAPPMILSGDFCFPNADYYTVAGCGCITTIAATFSRPTDIYTPMLPTGASGPGIVRVYDSLLQPVAPLTNTTDRYSLSDGLVYYVEVAAFTSRTDQWLHPLGTTYTISAGVTTMVPSQTPFPTLIAPPCVP